ncbi:peptidoglycan editing factor PgeF [Limnohabitans sp.]|jgi:YfiH family protein|uniref:peptidoglycan editing factor PgeF n=1 Tax=Limnohabitans sp. TaxID=1907725 RepID=UPI0037C12A6F
MTRRHRGVSGQAWSSLNLGGHVGDSPDHVQTNRTQLAVWMGRRPVFLNQVHGVVSVRLTPSSPDGQIADAAWASDGQVACAILVADCLPVLLCDAAGQWVAGAHAGWRGLAGVQGRGVLECLLSDLQCAGHNVSNVLAWLGPCIGAQAFEVGPEVKFAFDDGSPAVQSMFQARTHNKFMADLVGLARLRLKHLGVTRLFGNDGTTTWCTASQPHIFFSHRRDSRTLGQTGRMAACIWLDV